MKKFLSLRTYLVNMFGVIGCILASFLTASLYLLWNERSLQSRGFEIPISNSLSTDWPAFLIWTTFFAVLIVSSSGPLHELLSRKKWLYKLLGIVVICAFYSFVLLIGMQFLLGAWLRAFSFPILLVWILSGGVSLSIVIYAKERMGGAPQ